MKLLFLMRHGQADFSALSDAQRALTPVGKEQATQTAQALQKSGYFVDLLLCSPLLRAQQSAQCIEERLHIKPQVENALDGRLSAQGLLDLSYELLEQYDHVMLVGHNPNISLAAGLLSGNYLSFRPGQCAGFDLTDSTRPKMIFQEIP